MIQETLGDLTARRLRESGVHAEVTFQGDDVLCPEIFLGPSKGGELKAFACGTGGILLLEGQPGGPFWLVGCYSLDALEDLAESVSELSAR